MFFKNKSGIPIKFTFLALALGFIAGFFSVIYLSSTGNLLLELNQKPCYKFTGENKDAFCDEKGNLHIYFKGNSELGEGWYITESNECVYCNQVTGGN
ncbi:MAG: hypothetical protein ABH986_03350 [archaeon]